MHSLRDTARTIFEQALADCSVRRAMERHVRVQGEKLYLGEDSLDIGNLRRLRVVAVGKAASAMLSSLLELVPVPSTCDVSGILIAPSAPSKLPPGFQHFAGGHPLPNEASLAGAQAALAMLDAVPKTDDTLCLFLLSGGASAMMELPLDPAISLADTAAFHRVLVASGASITEINCVRKHFSAVKGGRLALAARNARCYSLLVSDVPLGQEDALGSGPTLPDSSTVEQCRQILAHHEILPQFPAAVQRFFTSSALPETPKPATLHASACMLLHTDHLAEAARRRAEALGWTVILDNTCDDWDYKEAAHYLLGRLRALQQQHERVCLLSAGEVVVRLPASKTGEPVGIGGRNQQFALYAATLLNPEDRPIAVLSAGSDGIDGTSPAAGAVVDETTLNEQSINFPETATPFGGTSLGGPDRRDSYKAALDALAKFNTYPFLMKRHATVMTGPTGNNLRDLRILLG